MRTDSQWKVLPDMFKTFKVELETAYIARIFDQVYLDF